MKDSGFPDNYDDMTDEEKAEFDRRLEKIMSEQPHLQGLVQAPQMLYGPPGMLNNGGMADFMGMMMQPKAPENKGEWLDDTRWRCSCGSENTSKFCAECGLPAPRKPWKCPECGTENKGKFCTECGAKCP